MFVECILYIPDQITGLASGHCGQGRDQGEIQRLRISYHMATGRSTAILNQPGVQQGLGIVFSAGNTLPAGISISMLFFPSMAYRKLFIIPISVSISFTE